MNVRSVFVLGAITRCIAVILAVACVVWPRLADAQEAPVAVEPDAKQGVSAVQPADGPFVKIDGGFMVPYKATIPGTDTTFEMVPVPGGTFTMGSPEDEEGREKDEGPQFEVVVKPFWMGKHEVTWEEYEHYMELDFVFKELARKNIRKRLREFDVDAVSAPSALYTREAAYAPGEEHNHPAATMSQHGAKQYTKWLSLTSQMFYRLPYEAEWEYACRAATKTAFSFGDNAEFLKDHAWFAGNSDEERHLIGSKKPNAFGLYDMHGNVAEWVLDAYNKNGYTHLKAGHRYTVEQTHNKPKTIYSRVLRGGSWELNGDHCRSASRLGSCEEWKDSDPEMPRSPWWYTDSPGTGTGFRLIRPLEAPKTLAAKNEYWDPELGNIASNVVGLAEDNGRGAIGKVDERLPEEMAKVLDE